MPKVGLVKVCGLFGITRQAYYNYFWKQQESTLEESIVLNMVNSIRESQPKLGGKKLYYLLGEDIRSHQIKMGRDAFFDLLARNGLLVKRRKVKPYTTNSLHHYKKYPNLIENIIVSAPNQLWVSDITYLETDNGFVYLSLITDAFSKKVVGFHVSNNLSRLNNMIALSNALKTLGKPAIGLIHHSDRGSQYCSKDYTDLLKKNHILISMTENGDPRENAIAERINGTIKNELLEHIKIIDLPDAVQQVNRAIAIYNQQRPHLSCGYLTPEQAHSGKYKFEKKWKNYYLSNKNVPAINNN